MHYLVYFVRDNINILFVQIFTTKCCDMETIIIPLLKVKRNVNEG